MNTIYWKNARLLSVHFLLFKMQYINVCIANSNCTKCIFKKDDICMRPLQRYAPADFNANAVLNNNLVVSMCLNTHCIFDKCVFYRKSNECSCRVSIDLYKLCAAYNLLG